MGYEISKARIESEHEAALMDVKLYRERLLAKVHAQDRISRTKLQTHVHLESKQIETVQIAAQSQTNTVNQAHHESRTLSQPDVQKLGGEKIKLKSLLLRRLSENPNRSMETLGKLVKASPKTIQNYMAEMFLEGKLRTANDMRSGYSIANVAVSE